MNARRHVHYSGNVQGVGFRYAARGLVQGRAVTGFVRNLPDGRVEVVVEGEGGEVAGFLEEIRAEMQGYIEDARVDDEPPTGEFSTFQVMF